MPEIDTFSEGTAAAEPEKITLCLSGGGLRATFYHLGTIKALYARGWLDRVDLILSVSGGSILAVLLALNWTKFCGNHNHFAEAEGKVRHLGARDLRGRVSGVGC